MASEATGRAVEFLVLAFAVGLGLWMLRQVRFTKAPDWSSGDGQASDDGAAHHHGTADHSGDAAHGGDDSGDGGH